MTEIHLKSFLVANVHIFVKNSKAVCKTLKNTKTQKCSFLGNFLVLEAGLGYLCTR